MTFDNVPFIRSVDKDDIITILDEMTDWITFSQLRQKLDLPQNILSEILFGLSYFGLIEQDGRFFKENVKHRQIWEEYKFELDYLKLWRSDQNKLKHKKKGVCTSQVPVYKDHDFNVTPEEDNEETENDEIFTFCED